MGPSGAPTQALGTIWHTKSVFQVIWKKFRFGLQSMHYLCPHVTMPPCPLSTSTCSASFLHYRKSETAKMEYIVFSHKDSHENKMECEREREWETEREEAGQSRCASCRVSRIWFQALVNILGFRNEDWGQFLLLKEVNLQIKTVNTTPSLKRETNYLKLKTIHCWRLQTVGGNGNVLY